MPEIRSLDDFHGFYYDVTADGSVTALDALRVINEVDRRALGGESEWIPIGQGLAEGSQDAGAELQSGLTGRFGISSDPPTAVSKLTAVVVARDQALQESYAGKIEPASNAPDEARNADLIDAALALLSDL